MVKVDDDPGADLPIENAVEISKPSSLNEEEQKVLPVGLVIQSFKKADRDPVVAACAVYMVFLLSFCLIMTMVRPVHTTFTLQQAVWAQLATEAMDPATVPFDKTWFDIANYGDFWLWVTSVLYGASYKCCHVNGESFAEHYGPKNDFQVAKFNRIITPIRFRQMRTKMGGECAYQTPEDNHEFARPCWDQWGLFSGSAEESHPRAEFSKYMTDLSLLRGDADDGSTYGYTGHVVDLPLNRTEAKQLIDKMMEYRWTDEWTRAVAIDVNFYNPNYDMATVLRFTVDIVAGGHFFPKAQMLSCRLNPYSSGGDSFRMVVEFIFGVLLIHYLIVEVKKMRYEGFKPYIKKIGNVVELLNLFCFVWIVISWVQYVMADKEPFRARNHYEFQDLYTVAQMFNSTTELTAFNVVWSFMKIFKYLKLYTRFMLIFDVIAHSMGGIMPFSLVIMIIITAFCFSAYWLYGGQVYEYHTFKLAFSYLLRSSVDGFEYEPMKLAQPKAAPIWALGWTFASTLVYLNMFIAILCDSYVFIQDRTKKQDQMEQGYPLPSWVFWARSKFPCFKAPTVEADAKLKEMRKEGGKLRSQLGAIDREGLWKFLLKQVADETYDVNPADILKFFPGDGEEQQAQAKEWMDKFAEIEGIMMKPTEVEATTAQEIQVLRKKIVTLEEEIDQLCSGLDLVALPSEDGDPGDCSETEGGSEFDGS